MYKTKRIGPRTDPWGIPEVTSFGFDATPLTMTFCCRLSRNDSIHLEYNVPMLYSFSLYTKRI